MNASAPCTRPHETAPLVQPSCTLTERIEQAMRIARMAVEQYEASASAPAESASSGRQPHPGTLFLRAANTVLNSIFGQSRLADRHPALPHTHQREAEDTISVPEKSRAEPIRQAPNAVTRNNPHGEKILTPSPAHPAVARMATPRRAAGLPGLLRRICNEAEIRLNRSQWRKATRDLSRAIRAAPA